MNADEVLTGLARESVKQSENLRNYFRIDQWYHPL